MKRSPENAELLVFLRENGEMLEKLEAKRSEMKKLNKTG
jgi:hypothetical protein